MCAPYVFDKQFWQLSAQGLLRTVSWEQLTPLRCSPSARNELEISPQAQRAWLGLSLVLWLCWSPPAWEHEPGSFAASSLVTALCDRQQC
jgi:hypothetical protein